ncbi:MAG: hypothetical protein H7222_04910 [Methylotenera sp.]|nr:hypothetical protein [Oligoflexia bacterium]
MSSIPPAIRKSLLKNPHVLKITEKQVVFTPQFKIKAVDLSLNGFSADEIFAEHGIDPKLFKAEYCSYLLKKWKLKHREKGRASLLEDGRGLGSTGRPKRLDLDELSVEDLKDIIVIQEELIEAIKKKKALVKKN